MVSRLWCAILGYRLNYHSLFNFLKHNFPQSFRCPGCFAVPDSSLLIFTIRDSGVRLYVMTRERLRHRGVGVYDSDNIVQSHPAVPDLALSEFSLSQIDFGDFFRLHRNTPHCPGFCTPPDRMDIWNFITPAHMENKIAVPDFSLLLA